MFLRGDIWRAVAINRLQAPTLLSLRDSRPAKTKASVQSTRPNIILRAFRCTDSINSSRYKGIAAQTGEAYSTMDLTILQQTNTRSLVPSPTLLRVRSTNNRLVAFLWILSQCSFQERSLEIITPQSLKLDTLSMTNTCYIGGNSNVCKISRL